MGSCAGPRLAGQKKLLKFHWVKARSASCIICRTQICFFSVVWWIIIIIIVHINLSLQKTLCRVCSHLSDSSYSAGRSSSYLVLHLLKYHRLIWCMFIRDNAENNTMWHILDMYPLLVKFKSQIFILGTALLSLSMWFFLWLFGIYLTSTNKLIILLLVFIIIIVLLWWIWRYATNCLYEILDWFFLVWTVIGC